MDPLRQFAIHSLLQISIGHIDISFTNSALFMVISVVLILGLMVKGMEPAALVPGRLQSMAELVHDFIATMVRENAGPDARPYFPFVFSLFMFILVGNLVGMIPGSFTYTSHIIVTFCLALMVFVFVTALGLIKHGLHFFSLFMPHGAPVYMAPILIPIEIISYLSRPVSLSIRLFANMMAGHTMLDVFAGFIIMMAAGMGTAGYLLGVLPVAVNFILIGFEFLVAALQAYVFTILTCIYIRDSLELH